MEWSEQHDQLLCREVLVSEPFRFPKRSKERGEIWDQIAKSLNGISQPQFRVTKRSVRDRLTLLLTKHKQKIRTEERASGIECEETEVDAALADIFEKEKLADQEREKDATVTAKKNARDKAAAEEVRIKAMERLGTNKRRHGADIAEEGELPPKKGRRQSSDVYLYLREKHERDSVLKNEEMAWKKKDYEQRMVQEGLMENQNKTTAEAATGHADNHAATAAKFSGPVPAATAATTTTKPAFGEPARKGQAFMKVFQYVLLCLSTTKGRILKSTSVVGNWKLVVFHDCCV